MLHRNVQVSELALKRYVARSASARLRFEGRRVRVTRTQSMSTPLGFQPFTAQLTVVGERQFGGVVWFEAEPRVEVEGAFPEGARCYLPSAGSAIVGQLAELCRCGLYAELCDCCEACEGKGFLASAPGEAVAVCGRCEGRGYSAGGASTS